MISEMPTTPGVQESCVDRCFGITKSGSVREKVKSTVLGTLSKDVVSNQERVLDGCVLTYEHHIEITVEFTYVNQS